MANEKKLNKRQVFNIVTMYLNDTPKSAIAAKYNVSVQTITYHLKRSARSTGQIELTEKETSIKNKAQKMPAREIAKIVNLEETTTRNYACARRVPLYYDRIPYSKLDLKVIEKYINGKSNYDSIAQLAMALNRSYSSVYQKYSELKEQSGMSK